MSNQFFQLFFFLFNLFFKVLSHSFNIGFSDTPCSNSSCLARKYSSTQSIDSEFHMLHSGYLNLEFCFGGPGMFFEDIMIRLTLSQPWMFGFTLQRILVN